MRLLLLMLLLISFAHAEEFDARVIAVMDGDTVMVLRDGKKIKVRLANIDAPEKDQPYGEAATRALSALVLDQRVEVTTVAIDAYGRTIAQIQLSDVQVNTELVRRGLAWTSAYRSRADLKEVQREYQFVLTRLVDVPAANQN